MIEQRFTKEPVLVVGSCNLTYSISICISQAGFAVTLYTKEAEAAKKRIDTHLADLDKINDGDDTLIYPHIVTELNANENYDLVIAITDECLEAKKNIVTELEGHVSSKAMIAINIESILLSQVHQVAKFPARIIGVNWSEPAHTTYFLEIITNPVCNTLLVDRLIDLAKNFWKKDPYTSENDCGIRAKLECALIREAFYLVENEFASIEDIDRACRNDAGYYLPFAGNFRYMDLMGPYAYASVMKDLNSSLSSSTQAADFFNSIIAGGGEGMQNNKGLYEYEDNDVAKWDEVFRQFSYEIEEIIGKYPFNYPAEAIGVDAEPLDVQARVKAEGA